jgi:uncharacterized membrane protein
VDRGDAPRSPRRRGEREYAPPRPTEIATSMVPSVLDQPWIRGYGPDVAALVLSVAMVAAYYLYLRARVRRDPSYSIHFVNEFARRVWVEHVMGNPGKDVMAVQTMRNFIMVGILMVSTATLLIIGTLTLSGQADNISKSWHAINAFGAPSAEVWIIKVMCLLADFVVAFFAFAMAVRIANHVLFLVNVPKEFHDANPALAPRVVAQRLNRAGTMMAVGMRCLFFAVPLVFWLFGPAFLLLATVGLVFALFRLDRNQADI